MRLFDVRDDAFPVARTESRDKLLAVHDAQGSFFAEDSFEVYIGCGHIFNNRVEQGRHIALAHF